MAGKTVQQGACILIIEDDRNMQQQLSRWLTTRNYKLITAEDQTQGREALEKNDVDLVLMDVELPDGDDIYFCSDLDAIKSVPIIIITGAHVQDDDEIAGFNALAHDCIRKPITNPKVLLARVEAALRNNKTKMHNNTIASGRFELDLKRSVLKTDTGQWPLTPSECKLMEILMINPDGVLEHVKLQEHLHDMASEARDNAAIHTCIHRLKQKILGGSNELWPIESIRGVGYKWNSVKAQCGGRQQNEL